MLINMLRRSNISLILDRFRPSKGLTSTQVLTVSQCTAHRLGTLIAANQFLQMGGGEGLGENHNVRKEK